MHFYTYFLKIFLNYWVNTIFTAKNNNATVTERVR